MVHCNPLTKHLRTNIISAKRPRTTICTGYGRHWISYRMSSRIQRLLLRYVKCRHPVQRPTIVLVKPCIAGASTPHHHILRISPDQINIITWDRSQNCRAYHQRTCRINPSEKSGNFCTPVQYTTSYTRKRRRQEKSAIYSESSAICSIKHNREAHKCTHKPTQSLLGEAECSLPAIMLYTGTMEDTSTATKSSTRYRTPRNFEHRHISTDHGRSTNIRPVPQRTR